MKKKGFTLVELLAVIVILAVILVIAVPKIMDVIENTRLKSIETTARMIINTAEKEYTRKLVLGESTNTITCNSIVKMNEDDYESCSISFSNSLASINLVGDNKFEGYSCTGNKNTLLCRKSTFVSPPPIYCTYGEELVSNETYYENGQYMYEYKPATAKYPEGWSVYVSDPDSTDPITSAPCTYVDDLPVFDMSFMFEDSQAESIDLSSFNTSNVIDMYGMFSGSQATSLDLSTFDTSNVIYMDDMFSYTALTTITFGDGFDTSDVTDMSAMFASSSIETLDLSKFDFTNVKVYDYMFAHTNATTGYVKDELNASKLNANDDITLKPSTLTFGVVGETIPCKYNGELISNTTTYTYEDYTYTYIGDAWKVKVTDPTKTGTIESKVCKYVNGKPITSMEGMFENSQATSIDLSTFDTSNVTNMANMFKNSKATSIDLSKFDTSNVINMTNMFTGSVATTGYAANTTDVTKFNNVANKPNSLVFEFIPCRYYGSYIPYSSRYIYGQYTYIYQKDGWGVELTDKESTAPATSDNVCSYINGMPLISMRDMFRQSQVTSIDMSGFDTSHVTDMSWMFSENPATEIILGNNFNTGNVTNMYSMFAAANATTIDLSHFNTSDVINMSSMFASSKFATIDLSTFDTGNVTDMSSMFNDTAASSITFGPNFDTGNVIDMYSMFAGARATTLDLSTFNTSHVKNMIDMFLSSKLTTIDLSTFDTSNVISMENMFDGSIYATTGYARTQGDVNKFNASSGKPAGLTFVVKPT